jgi:nitrite reductase (NADH) small subunit
MSAGRARALDVAALAAGRPVLATVGGRDVLVCLTGDEILAIANECPHQGGSLADGWVEGEIVTCPLHGWEVDLRSGACMTVPGERVPRYRVSVEDGGVYLEEAS